LPKKQKERKGKRARKKHEKKKKGAYYKAGEALQREKRFCPKCGAGVFMAEHSDRLSCGKCSYTEWKNR
jgi:small subunit ribosomal protein S27Ae